MFKRMDIMSLQMAVMIIIQAQENYHGKQYQE